jgi:hypothetical protein
MYGAPMVNQTLIRGFPNESFSSVIPYESFRLFESAPRYGLHHNLLFQVMN